ncbi:MAG TPA: LysE family translocator [bacterium]|nr:LysE family translocator [bacterium]
MAFLLFAIVAAVTPGPSNIMLTAVGAHAGVLRGLPALLGVMAGMGLMMFVVPLGLGSLVLQHPLLLWALKGGGATFLLWLSWKIATSSGRIDSQPDRNPVGFRGAAVFQLVNPKSWLVSAAAGSFLSAEAGSAVVQAASLGGLFILAALPSCFVWLAFGAAVQRALHSRRRLRIFNITMGALLALSIVLIVR